jgi:YesN/AraC family two-component response regulator
MGYTIVLVDDSNLVRSGLKTMLEKSGNWDQIITAENGKVGLETILRVRPDIVCTDIEMPEMDGLQLLEELSELKERGELAEQMPVVVLSGTMHENEPNVRKARMLGADDVLAKPDGKAATLKIDTRELEEHLLALLS